MNREVPWRNKPTTLITQMLPVSSEMKLYLINQIGPTSFLFKDQNDNKFKVNIGSKISCSCGIVENDHCIHTLYVMLKKFKVPQTHPIIWQASYLDSELEGLIQLKYMQKKKQSNTSKFKPRRKLANTSTNGQNNEDFPPLDEDITCPICYEDMVNQCYSKCSTCKKCMHSKCLKVWILHKQDHSTSVTCPMCRSQFHNPSLMVHNDIQKWQKRFTTHKGTTCKTCGIKNIKGLIYKCLICPNTDLCKFCYEGNQHFQHDKFLLKQMSNQNWKIPPIRIKKSYHQLFDVIKQIQTRDLPSDINSPQFIMSIFPTIKQYNGAQDITTLGIIGNQIILKQICYKCQNIGNDSMKRLNCGHTIHQNCLRDMIDKNDYFCQVDLQPICPGYLSAMGIKVKPKKKNIMVDAQFIRSQQQSNQIKVRLGGGGGGENIMFGLGTKIERLNEKSLNISTSNKQTMKKSKDQKFRITKKSAVERAAQLQQIGPIIITCLNQNFNPQLPPQPSIKLPPRSRTTPKYN